MAVSIQVFDIHVPKAWPFPCVYASLRVCGPFRGEVSTDVGVQTASL